MAEWDEVRALALALPEAEENDRKQWRVRGKLFAWDRPLRQSDIARLAATGDVAPDGEILATRVADEGVKAALIADEPAVYFTIEHFNGYAAVLVHLAAIDTDGLTELLTEAWRCRAPARLRAAFDAGRQ